MQALARDFEIADEEGVLEFLERYPSVPPLLLETREAVRRFFGEDQVRLDVFRDPECPEDEKLLVNVLLHAGPREALELLDRFDDEWWTKRRQGLEVPILVSLALQKRV
jgi:hypothetical protein